MFYLIKPATDKCFLLTLLVHLWGKNNVKYVRVLYDSGSQNSYIMKYASSTMAYENIGEENILYSLFDARRLWKGIKLFDFTRTNIEAL